MYLYKFKKFICPKLVNLMSRLPSSFHQAKPHNRTDKELRMMSYSFSDKVAFKWKSKCAKIIARFIEAILKIVRHCFFFQSVLPIQPHSRDGQIHLFFNSRDLIFPYRPFCTDENNMLLHMRKIYTWVFETVPALQNPCHIQQLWYPPVVLKNSLLFCNN